LWQLISSAVSYEKSCEDSALLSSFCMQHL
jgi:hypothetical protein